MESFSNREVSTTNAGHAISLGDHLRASAYDQHSRATTHPTEPVTHPTEPVTHPTEPVTHPTEPVTHPTEPVTHPTEPPGNPTEPHPPRNHDRPVAPPAQYTPYIPEQQETSNPPKTQRHTPIADQPTQDKPIVVVTPPEHSGPAPTNNKDNPVLPPGRHDKVIPPEHHKFPGLDIVYDHSYKSDQERRTIQHRVIHTDAKVDGHKHVTQSEHEKEQHHRVRHTHHQDSHRATHSAHHQDSSDHTTHSTHHHPHHHAYGAAHQSESHHHGNHHSLTPHAVKDHANTQHKISQSSHEKDTKLTTNKAHHTELQKDVDVTTIRLDKKHVEEKTHFEIHIPPSDVTVPAASGQSDLPKEPVVPAPKDSVPADKSQEGKVTVVPPPDVVPSPPAQPTTVEKPGAVQALKPSDLNELSLSHSGNQETLGFTHQHYMDPKTYYRATINAGVGGDHVGLGNTELIAGRSLFAPYDKDGNPARGNINLEAGAVFKTGRTYEYGKLPLFGDNSLVVGVNGYYDVNKHRDLTLYGSLQHATNPKQYDLQFGAIKTVGNLSLQAGTDISGADGSQQGRYGVLGGSYKLSRNTEIYASGAFNLDGHKETNSASTGFRFRF